MNKRIFLIVIDSFGIGEAPDSAEYGDAGSNTFINLNRARPLNLPNMTKLGLKNIDDIGWTEQLGKPEGIYGKLRELSKGKDTTTGHFEMMDIITKIPDPTYPNGFPHEVVKQLEEAFGCEILGNCVASGTTIINRLGEEHCKTGKPIVYTSADSVLQIATNVDVYSLDKLYDMCTKAREVMTGKHAIGRVIARPFKRTENGFERIPESRKDFALNPKVPNTMSRLVSHNKDVIAVGKIEDIFNNKSITKSYVNHTNRESLEVVKSLAGQDFNGLAFVNLVDTDMLFGHRNDIEGYADALEKIDRELPEIINRLNPQDYLIISADHGCDPTTVSSDHSREYVPLLIYSKALKFPINLGILDGFNNIGHFIENCFGIYENKSTIMEKIYEKNN